MKKNKLQKTLEKSMNLFFNKMMGSGLAQEENTADGQRYITPNMPDQLRRLAEEGIVLLKNEGNVLPIRPDQTLSVFGRIQHDWFYVGYGSGGDVHPPYQVGFFEGLEQAGIPYNMSLRQQYDTWASHPDNEAERGYWGHWPYCQEEMPLEESMVIRARSESDAALVVIGRAAGEDRENQLSEGSYYLTQAERQMLALVTRHFDKTILLLDCGNVIDLSFTEDYPISAILYAWQLGQENANAIGSILSGRVSPSGKLSDTIARRYEDYPSSANFGGRDFNNYAEDIYVGYRYFSTFAPDRVLYPFGFGLSYTTFGMEATAGEGENALTAAVTVTNTGAAAGKEVVQLYVEAPQGVLGKPKQVLAGFAKTKLLQPNESQTLQLTIPFMDFASYDDAGLTGHKDCFLLEAGEYRIYVGGDSVNTTLFHSFTLPETLVLSQCEEICSPQPFKDFNVLNPLGDVQCVVTKGGKMLPARPIAEGTRDLRERILARLPEALQPTGDRGIVLEQVRQGQYTLEEFIAQLSDEELCDLTRGEGMMGSKFGTEGNAGAFGGITESLRQKGIRPIITADGPAGLRVRRYTSLLPCGTAIACTWNQPLVEETFQRIGQEAAHFGIDMNLAPGMNLHRNPLCGRNFEYYAEDPMLSGRIAAATVRGLQSGGTSACPKHFACNNQETNRNYNDSRVSVRALRELYLKNFEYCVREGKPQSLMTSYNRINGVWSHYNYDLVTTVLRREWGYEGVVITDWWMRRAVSPEFPAVADNAYRTRAQVDVLMPGSLSPATQKFKHDTVHERSLTVAGGLTRGELQQCAANVLRFILSR